MCQVSPMKRFEKILKTLSRFYLNWTEKRKKKNSGGGLCVYVLLINAQRKWYATRHSFLPFRLTRSHRHLSMVFVKNQFPQNENQFCWLYLGLIFEITSIPAFFYLPSREEKGSFHFESDLSGFAELVGLNQYPVHARDTNHGCTIFSSFLLLAGVRLSCCCCWKLEGGAVCVLCVCVYIHSPLLDWCHHNFLNLEKRRKEEKWEKVRGAVIFTRIADIKTDDGALWF